MINKGLFAILYLIFIIAALFNEGVPSLVKLMIIIGYFYVYSVFTNKKVLFYVTSILLLLLSILCYLYFYMDYTMPVSIRNYKIGEGFCCFVAASICLLINIFIPIKKDNETKKDKKTSEIVKAKDKNYKYIFITYISGFKSLPSMSECSVVYDEDNKQLCFYVVNGEKVDNINISCNTIKKINIEKQVLFSTNTKKPINNELANFLLLSTMNGFWGGYIAESSLLNSKGNNEETEFYNNYEIIISYLCNSEEKKIYFKTSVDPSKFFSLVESTK